MKAVVFHAVGDIRLDNVPEPKIQQPTDAIIRITASAICGTDLHMVRGTMSDMKPGTILGHEAVGVVEEVGRHVRDLRPGDRVVVPSTIACGYCSYCRAGYFSQCDNANPNGPQAGTCFFGGPKASGPVDGLQAEYARIPFANVGLVKLPPEVNDDQAVLISDIFPTGYFGADLANIHAGHTVAVFGCGPVGQFAILSARLLGATRVFAVDRLESRLDMARAQGAEVINFDQDDPVATLRELTGGIGPDRVIDAVGVDAEPPAAGPARQQAQKQQRIYQQELEAVAPEQSPHGDLWKPGQAPSLVTEWAVQAIAKGGTLSVIGVYPPTMNFFPFGQALSRNLTIRGGNCNHRKYMPMLVEMVRRGSVQPTAILTQIEPISNVIEAYEAFDLRKAGWIKVEINPHEAAAGGPRQRD